MVKLIKPYYKIMWFYGLSNYVNQQMHWTKFVERCLMSSSTNFASVNVHYPITIAQFIISIITLLVLHVLQNMQVFTNFKPTTIKR
jgi:hypothetical protein